MAAAGWGFFVFRGFLGFFVFVAVVTGSLGDGVGVVGSVVGADVGSDVGAEVGAVPGG